MQQNTLTNAITNHRSLDEIYELLEKQHKLTVSDLGVIISSDQIDPVILELLNTYHALPKDISFTTLKVILYLKGNKNIQPHEFLQDDLNANGCPGLEAPIKIAVQHSHVNHVIFLINLGATERPIDILFPAVDRYEFNVLASDIYDINTFKKRISDMLSNQSSSLGHNIEEKFKIAELLINSPTDDLYSHIEKSDSSFIEKLYPFLAWLAKHNKIARTTFVERLFYRYPQAESHAVFIATAFGSEEYVKVAMNSGRLTIETIRIAMSIAIATCNNHMLITIVDSLSHLGLSIKDLSIGDSCQSIVGQVSPLAWAIHLKNKEAISYLLEQGMDSNGCNASSGGTYLHSAVTNGDNYTAQQSPHLSLGLLSHKKMSSGQEQASINNRPSP